MILIEKKIELEKAQKVLAWFKKKEREKKRYTWTRKDLIVSHSNMDRLKEMVKDLGYEWKEGKIR